MLTFTASISCWESGFGLYLSGIFVNVSGVENLDWDEKDWEEAWVEVEAPELVPNQHNYYFFFSE